MRTTKEVTMYFATTLAALTLAACNPSDNTTVGQRSTAPSPTQEPPPRTQPRPSRRALPTLRSRPKSSRPWRRTPS